MKRPVKPKEPKAPQKDINIIQRFDNDSSYLMQNFFDEVLAACPDADLGQIRINIDVDVDDDYNYSTIDTSLSHMGYTAPNHNYEAEMSAHAIALTEHKAKAKQYIADYAVWRADPARKAKADARKNSKREANERRLRQLEKEIKRIKKDLS